MKWCFFFLFVAGCLAIPAGMKRLTLGFKIAKVQLEMPFCSDWNAASELSEKEAVDILEEPFRYLGKGAQCYAFLSQDEKYVLKIFRFDQKHLFFGKRSKWPFEQKISRFFEGCVLASAVASEETGLLYLHLNQTVGKLPLLMASGPLGQALRLPLDEYRFALQKKAMPLVDGLVAARVDGKLPERIEMIVALLESRIGRGIGNSDPSLFRNFGFLESSAIEFDFGNYVARPDLSDPLNAQVEMERYIRPLRTWLEKNAPECLPDLKARIERSRSR
jgi:hypothetical protein